MAERTALWVVPVSDIAGVARHVLDVTAAGLPGWSIVVVTPPGPLAEELTALGSDVHVDRLGPRFGVLASVRAIRRAVNQVRPDLIHSHLAYADIATALAFARRRVPLVSTEHGIAPDDAMYHGSRAKSSVMALVHRVRIRRYSSVIAVSNATADAIRAKWRPPSRVALSVIYNGCDRSSARRAVANGMRVASLARLAPEKRIARTIDAFAVLQALRHGATLTIAGSGSLRSDLEQQVRSARLAESVRFVGHVDPPDLLADTDVLLQLSVWENCSYALLDAMSMGCGVVATRVGGNPELLPGHCLVDEVDSISQIAERVRQQAEDVAARPSLPVTWPTVRSMCQSIAAVYDGLLS